MDVLDTTAVSAAMRADPNMMRLLQRDRPGDYALVPPVVAEIEYGIQRLPAPSRKRALLSERRTELFAVIGVLDWTPRASVEFGRIKAALERAGSLVDDFDIAVAAICLAHGAGVVTANLAHYARIEGLRCRHWVEAAASEG